MDKKSVFSLESSASSFPTATLKSLMNSGRESNDSKYGFVRSGGGGCDA